MQDLLPAKFLIVDDDAFDVMATRRNLKKLKLTTPTLVARDGAEALEILRREIDQSEYLPPFIVTLDWNMPRMGGREFLEELSNDPTLRSVAVFVWSSGDPIAEVDASRCDNVAGYIDKERGEETLKRALSTLEGRFRPKLNHNRSKQDKVGAYLPADPA